MALTRERARCVDASSVRAQTAEARALVDVETRQTATHVVADRTAVVALARFARSSPRATDAAATLRSRHLHAQLLLTHSVLDLRPARPLAHV